MSLPTIVQRLIEQRKEGVFWDFKECHHDNNAELIHDITCLSNADYLGDRYLIYGVSNDFSVVGITKGSNQKNQAQIIDTLRNANFADGIFPDVILESIELNNKRLDILIIQNRANKPYYLLKDKSVPKTKGKEIIVHAYHVYTRTMDTNTPINQSANSKQVEQMWRERFGLTQTPFDRLNLYLLDTEGWEQNQEYVFFYKQHPEFTIQVIEKSVYEGNERLEWARGEIGYHYDAGNSTSCWGFFYHNTKLSECLQCQFDGGKKSIVTPTWEVIGKGRLYYFIEDSLKYRLHHFLVQSGSEIDNAKGIRKKGGETFDIPVFKNQADLNNFLLFAKTKLNLANVETEPSSNEDEQNTIFYQLVDLFNEYRFRITNK